MPPFMGLAPFFVYRQDHCTPTLSSIWLPNRNSFLQEKPPQRQTRRHLEVVWPESRQALFVLIDLSAGSSLLPIHPAGGLPLTSMRLSAGDRRRVGGRLEAAPSTHGQQNLRNHP